MLDSHRGHVEYMPKVPGRYSAVRNIILASAVFMAISAGCHSTGSQTAELREHFPITMLSIPCQKEFVCYVEKSPDKDMFLRHRFESLTLRKYFDFSIKERSIFKRRYALG